MFVNAKDAMRFLGIGCKKTLARRRKSGKIDSRPSSTRHLHYEYWVDLDDVKEEHRAEWYAMKNVTNILTHDVGQEPEETEAQRADTVKIRGPVRDAAIMSLTEENDAADDGDDIGPPYFYREEADLYVFHLDAMAGRAFPVDGVTIRNAVTNYSNVGMAATVEEICRTHGWSRPVAMEILRRLGIQHTSLPFTDEEIEGREEDDLVQDVLALKKQKVHVKAQKKDWQNTLKKAEKWDNLQHAIIAPLSEFMKAADPWEAPPTPSAFSTSPGAHVDVFIMPSDLHVNKYGWQLETGTDYDIAITRDRLLSAMIDLREKLLRYTGGKIRRIITGVGSDFFHVDNYAGGTTRGTRQDMAGSPAKMIHEGLKIWEMFINFWQDVAPVYMYAMSGNHDKVLSFCMLEWCAAKWEGHNRVTVEVSPAPRTYTRSGKTLVGISHSEDTKHKDLPELMALEAREQWGETTQSVWFTGHWHQDRQMESRGTKIITIPSLAGSDRWHAQNGYVGNQKILPGYVISLYDGLEAQINGIPTL